MIGQTISHYKILEKLGEGGMGVVYKAEDTRLKRTAALKFLPPELTRDEEAKDRFIHEAQASAALDHSNICAIYEIGETDEGQSFIAMAHYEGETLKERIARGPLSVNEAVDTAVQVTQGLSRAHESGIVHRDIKPANIMTTARGEVKILDFGVAKLAGRTQVTKTGTTVGTAAYMSPEQARSEPVDHRTDIWSLGVILYEMLAGRPPFAGEYEQAVLYAIIHEESQSLGSLRREVPEELEQIVAKAMAKDRDARYGNVEALLEDLRSYAKLEVPLLATMRKKALSLRRSVRRRSTVLLAPVLLLVAGAIYLAYQEPITPTGQTRAIAVLPLQNLSGDPEQEYLGYIPT